MLRRKIVSFTFCINLAALCCVSAHTPEANDARIQTLPAYIIASKANFINGTTCGKELQNFRDAVDQRILWSLKVLDSNGGFKPGFLYGNNFWLGSRSQCLDTMNTSPLHMSKQKILNNTLYHGPQNFPPFKINYFAANIRHNSDIQYHTYVNNEYVITLGLCLPASCTIENLSFILESILRDRSIFIDDLYSANLQLIQIKDLKNDIKSLSYSSLGILCVVLIFSFMTITGTIYDVIWYQKLAKGNERNKTNGSIKYVSQEIEKKINLPSHPENKIGKILRYFSVYTNTKKIFNQELDTGTIPVIHGLKCLSMCCIITFHSIFFTWDTLENKIGFWRFCENYMYFIDIDLLSVDVFFLSSGCLVTYTYLRRTNGKKEPTDCREKLIELITHIRKRFIRLTPAYMVVIGLSQLSSAWFDKTSQFYVHERSHETCPKYWWRNLLYINNLFSIDDMCLTWSWYLANDMQFYVLAITLLIFSTVYFYVAVTILSALLIGSTILSGYIVYVHEYTLTLDELFRLADMIYTPPWMRINPYVIGMIAGYVLTKLNNTLALKRKVIRLCWFLASACIIGVFFVVYKRRLSVLATAIYVALYRIFFAIGIACIVIMCSTNHGGIVNQLLSFKGWIPFSRLTYCAYLLNPVIIRSINLYGNIATHFEFLPAVVMGVGYIAISYCCSYVLSLMVEIPCISLMQMFTPHRNKIYNKKVL